MTLLPPRPLVGKQKAHGEQGHPTSLFLLVWETKQEKGAWNDYFCILARMKSPIVSKARDGCPVQTNLSRLDARKVRETKPQLRFCIRILSHLCTLSWRDV